MGKWWKDLDRILRGEVTKPENLTHGKIEISVIGLSIVIFLLAIIYGVCMGCYAIVRPQGVSLEQLLASMIKVPLLFILTTTITFPSLYVFTTLSGSPLQMASLFRLLICSGGITLAVLSSLGPVVAFFSLCTTSYYFMVLLNVLVFAIAGALGLNLLIVTLPRLCSSVLQSPNSSESQIKKESEEQNDNTPVSSRPQRKYSSQREVTSLSQVNLIFRGWLIVFAIVGAQVSWILRPFIGSPYEPFTWFRPRQGNFFEGVWQAISKLFS